MCTTCGCSGSTAEETVPEQTERATGPEHEMNRLIRIEQDILHENALEASQNRAWFAKRNVLACNLVSSPGAGKTTLLTRTVAHLSPRFPVAVIEGDQQTTLDADRIRATGTPAIQVNTGKGCHLDAKMVAAASAELDLPLNSLLFIENVGNLVCPAAFDLGEAHKVLLVSVTEGDDKPLKYPDIFRVATLLLITKIDLLPYVDFDSAACLARARLVNPALRALSVSVTTGSGLESWYDWLTSQRSIQTC